MKNKKLFSAAICATFASFFLFSCSSQYETINGENDGKATIEKFLLSNNEQSVNFDIDYDVTSGYNVTFDVYSENPYSVNADGTITKSAITPIMSGMTDENGDYKLLRKIPGGVKEVYILSDCAGVPAILYGTIVNGTVELKPFEFNNTGNDASRSGNFSYLTLGRWNSLGKPDYVDNKVDFKLTSNEYKSISKALPEWKKANKMFTSQSSIFVEEDTEIWLSILSDKSLFNNSIGYYCYNSNIDKDNVKEIVAFPSTRTYSLLNGLKKGEYIKLKYCDPATGSMSDIFPAGTNIGFILRTSSFNNGVISSGNSQFYSNSLWNKENDNKSHCSIFRTSNDNVIVGFEDMNNEGLLGDNDCNDIIVHVKSAATAAIGNNLANIESDDSDITVLETNRAVRNLSDIVESAKYDPALKDMFVYTKSNFRTVNGNVIRVSDEIYVGSGANIKSILYSDFANLVDYLKTNVFVSVSDFFSRTEEEEKKPHLMHTTVKEMGYSVDEASRSFITYSGDKSPAELVKELIYQHKDGLANGSYLKLNMYVEFDPADYSEFVSTIQIPPYTPFIVNK